MNIKELNETIARALCEDEDKNVLKEELLNKALFETHYEDIINCLQSCISMVENSEKSIHPRHTMAHVIEKIGRFIIDNNVDAEDLINTLVEKTNNEFLK